MSAFDKLFGKEAEPVRGEIQSASVNPMMQMIGKLIPPQLVEQLGTQVAGVIQHFKDQQDIIIRQNTVIIANQSAIMAKLGIEHVGSDDQDRSGTDSVAA